MIGSNNKLTDKINDREVYMKEIDHSYYYEGYSIYKAEDLQIYTPLTVGDIKELPLQVVL